MHKFIIIFFSLLLTSLASAQEDSVPEVVIDGILYRLQPNSTAALTHCYPVLYSPESITVPSLVTIDGQSYPVTTIGQEAFRKSETESIFLPETIDSIGPMAFFDCSHLTRINLPEKLRTISDGLFWGCDSLQSLTIPESVTRVGVSAFRHCTDLQKIVIPNAVTEIGDEAFQECYQIKSITIGPNVKTIGRRAFYRLYYIKAIVILASEPPTLSANAMDYYIKGVNLYVPESSLSTYQQDPLWNRMTLKTIPLAQGWIHPFL